MSKLSKREKRGYVRWAIWQTFRQLYRVGVYEAQFALNSGRKARVISHPVADPPGRLGRFRGRRFINDLLFAHFFAPS